MKNHEPKTGAGTAQRTTSDAELVAIKLAACKKWKRVEDHRPAQSGWYPAIVRLWAGEERQFACVAHYDWPRDCWKYCAGELTVDGSGTLVSHWLDTPLPSLPPLPQQKEEAR